MNKRYTLKAVSGRLKGKFIKKNIKLFRETVINNVRKKSDECEVSLEQDQKISNSIPKNVIEGRRIVELSTLADQLWCSQCNLPLSLRYIIEEHRSGLASLLKVRCIQCKTIYNVDTNKKHEHDKRKYGINYKLVIGMYDIGVGEMQLNTFLSALNIPAISTSTIKRTEKIVGPVIENVAKESCKEAVRLEISLAEKLKQEKE